MITQEEIREHGGADGYYGSSTIRAVKEFQRQKGLVQDGICGSNTWKKISEDLQYFQFWSEPDGRLYQGPMPDDWANLKCTYTGDIWHSRNGGGWRQAGN